MRASIITTKVGSLTDAIEVASACWAMSSTLKLMLPPMSCQAIDSWCTIDSTSRRLSIQSISLKRRCFGARSVLPPSRPSIAVSTNCDSIVISSRVPSGSTTIDDRQRVGGEQRLRGRPRDLGGVERLELDGRAQLGGQASSRAEAEAVDRRA